MFCPKNMKPCFDDLCHCGGCMATDGAPMYYKCYCGEYVSDEDHDACHCDDEGDASWIIDPDMGAR